MEDNHTISTDVSLSPYASGSSSAVIVDVKECAICDTDIELEIGTSAEIKKLNVLCNECCKRIKSILYFTPKQ